MINLSIPGLRKRAGDFFFNDLDHHINNTLKVLMMRKIVLICLFMLTYESGAFAATHNNDRRDILPISSVSGTFSPEWNVRILGGGAFSLGEADFADLLSPSAQVSVGYRFSRLLGARVAFNGWQARNRYNYPRFDYTWNYVRSSAEIVLDVTSVLAGWREGRLVSVNLFAGGGTAVGFRNIEANRARRNNPDFQGLEKLWAGTRFFWAARGGLELDLRLARRLSICLESDAGIFPDEFNSKVGKDSGFDWQFNCLVGLKFDLGR